MTRFSECLPLILVHEGGYVDDPQDNGGATNLGITIGTLSQWIGHPATKAQVKALTKETVAPIYERNYWRAAGCDRLPAGVDYVMFDMAVLNGVNRTARWLQEVVGVPVDRVIGPKTVAAAQAMGAKTLIEKLTAKREAFYRGLADFPRFGRGWLRRCQEVKAKALEMAK